ncbi:MAG: DUF1800 family protein, partial [Chthoniobacteraceae bacterium]
MKMTPHRSISERIARAGLLVTAMLGIAAPAMADMTFTNMDVWRLKYGVTTTDIGNPTWLDSDTDGDGIKNKDEIAAGTNPFSPTATINITEVDNVTTPGAIILKFPTQAGKRYRAECTTTITNPASWAIQGAPLTGNGGQGEITIPYLANCFSRVRVDDNDTDGDGVSDWAEKITGFNPNSLESNGTTPDATALGNAIAAPVVVTVNVTKPSATQPADAVTPPVETGSVTVSRSGILDFYSLAVPLQKSGSAIEGTDYDGLVPAANFAPGVSQIVLTINPRFNASRRSNVTAIVKALAGTGYTVGPAGSVVINPGGIANGTGLTAAYQNASSSNYATQQGIFAGTAEMTRTDAVVDFGTTANGSTTSPIIASISLGNPCTITTTRDTSLTSLDSVTIAGVTGGTFSPTINGTFVVTVINSTTFTVASNCTVVPTALNAATLTTGTAANNGNGWASTATVGPRGMSSPAALNAFSVRWTGQILPQYSEKYFIDFRSDDGAKVWVNGVLLIDKWVNQSATEWVNSIDLTGGVLYDIEIHYYNNSGGAEAKLFWWSASQPKQIIPKRRLFPAPAQSDKFTAVTNALDAVGYVSVPFNLSIATPNIGGAVTYAPDVNSGPLPPGLSLNPVTGAITGTPTVAGTYNVAVNAVNSAAGGAVTGSSIINFTIYPVGSVTRETLAGSAITSDGTIATLDDDTDYPDNTSRRLRGYVVPPKTGNYYFWLAANNSAELWISTDSESVNRVRRARVSASTGKKVWAPAAISSISTGNPCVVTTTTAHGLANSDAVEIRGVTGGTFGPAINGHYVVTVTGATTFTVQSNCTVGPTSVANATATGARQSEWLSLVAGRKYYFDVLHNTGTDADDYVALGWCQDDIGTVPSVVGDVNPHGATPVIPNGGAALQGYPLSGTVPTYIFQPYDYPNVAPVTGTLYSANLGPQGSATTKSSGSANLQVNAAQTQAILYFNYQNLSSPRTGYHLHSDAFASHPAGEIVFDIDDIDAFHPELRTADGGYIWNFATGGTFTTIQQIRDAITGGKVYLNVHSVNYPAGEIRGNLNRVDGSQVPPEPTAYPEPAATDLANNDAHAARFLNQATFGASPADVAYVKANGFSPWIDDQLTKPASRSSNDVVAGLSADINTPYPTSLFTDAWWKYSITGQDQLRQRLAFALSEILVVSWANNTGPLQSNARVLADYYDNLVDYCLPTSGLADSGNFRGVLKSVTLTPAMGLYLDMRNNQKADLTIGRHPNENYAREIMQLFSVGINRVWDDGKFVLNSNAEIVPTYTQPTILGLSSLLTGWSYAQSNQGNGRLPANLTNTADYLNAMVLVPTQHDNVNAKLLLNNVVAPPATGLTPRVTLTSITLASPCVVNTSTVHGLKVGDAVRISNVTGGAFSSPINGMQIVTGIVGTAGTAFNVGPALNQFINCTGAPTSYTNAAVTGATVTPATYTSALAAVTGSQADNAGSTVPHPYDQYGLVELERAIDNICSNDNVPPYICRQLIQRLVTSDPSPGYVYRVVQKWKNNGSGVRGDLAAVVRQILLDGEARSFGLSQGQFTPADRNAFGKQREPMLRLTGTARAFPALPYTGTYVQLPADTINANKLRITTTSGLNDFSNGFSVSLSFNSPSNPATNPTRTTYSIGATLPLAATHTNVSSVATGASPIQITTTQPHGLDLMPGTTVSGTRVWFFGLSGTFTDMAINSGVKLATVTGSNTFTVNIGATRIFQVTKVDASATGVACLVTAAGHNIPDPMGAGTSTQVVLNGINGGVFSSSPNATVNATYVDANTFTIATTGNVPISCSSPPTSYTFWRVSTDPCRVTTQVPHGLVNGDSVTISGLSGGSFTPAMGTAFPVTVIDPTSFVIATSCASPSTPNTGNIQGGSLLDVNATGMVNVTYSQPPGSNTLTVNTGGPATDVPIPSPVSATTMKSKVYLDFLTASNSVVSIASIAVGNPCTVTTGVPHGLSTGQSVTISGVSGGTFSPSIINPFTVTVTGSNTFTVLSNCTVAPTAGTGTVTGTGVGTRPADGVYEVQTVNGSTSFTVFTGDMPATGRSGSVIVPKIATSYTPLTSNTIVQYNNNVNHNMLVGQ